MLTKEVLKGAILAQREFLNKSDQGTFRECLDKTKAEDSFATIIAGIRRCGKSTFLNQLLRRQKVGYYLNLEDPRLNGFELSDFSKVEEIMKEVYGNGGVSDPQD